jgi:hypothetical protein
MPDRTDWTGHPFEHFPELQDGFNNLMRAFDGIDELIADLRAEAAAAAPVGPSRSRWLGWVKRGHR